MNFDQEKSIMTLYIDNAKNYVQLSTGTLMLSVTFMEKVIGASMNRHPDPCLLLAWAALLLAVLCGALYQYLAVKYLDSLTDKPGSKGIVPCVLINNPGYVYGVMFILFFVGVLLIVAAVVRGPG